MLKWASFSSGSFRENNDFTNEGNKWLFTLCIRFVRANFRCTVKIKLRECVLLLSVSYSSCEQTEIFTLWASQIVFFHWESDSFFLQQNPHKYQCSNCQCLFPEVESIAERFSYGTRSPTVSLLRGYLSVNKNRA